MTTRPDRNGLQDLVDGALAGQVPALGRLISTLGEVAFDDLAWILGRCHERSGNAHLVGITGPPGVGKSTLLNRLVHEWRRSGLSVAVIAVDPSSVLSGGALLGDRVRMQDHWKDDRVFIRSLATRGAKGGLAGSASRSALVLEAAGYDIVALETVGVGQSEVDVMAAADTTILALAAGIGDGIQAAKGGILELADIFCINRSDQPEAELTVRHLRDAYAGTHRVLSIVKTVATTGEGLGSLAAAVEKHRLTQDHDSGSRGRKTLRARRAILDLADEYLIQRRSLFSEDRLKDLSEEVADQKLAPADAVVRLLELRPVVRSEVSPRSTASNQHDSY